MRLSKSSLRSQEPPARRTATHRSYFRDDPYGTDPPDCRVVNVHSRHLHLEVVSVSPLKEDQMNLRTTTLLATVLLMACEGGYNQGVEKFDDSGNGASGDDGGGDDGGGDDGGGDDGGGSDDGGGGDDGGGDDGGPTNCVNAWLPIDQAGWSKTFRVSFSGSEGTGTETGYGPIPDHPMSTEGDVYGVNVLIETSEWTYNIIESIGCDTDGEGMFLYDYAGDWSYVIVGFPLAGTVDASLSPHRRFLPPEYAVGASGNWNYNYTDY